MKLGQEEATAAVSPLALGLPATIVLTIVDIISGKIRAAVQIRANLTEHRLEHRGVTILVKDARARYFRAETECCDH